jgi:hypothetical protein
MSNNLYNILAAFNNATKSEVETPKQQAQKIYESVESKGSIMGGVKGVEKKLSEAFAAHKVNEAQSPKSIRDSIAVHKAELAAKRGGDTSPAWVKAKEAKISALQAKLKSASKVDEGKMSDLDYELKAKEVSDAEFKKKYGKSKAEMRKSMSEKKPVKETKRDPDTTPSEWDDGDLDEAAGDDIQWYDRPDDGDSTQDTDTGRIHRAGRGGYGNKVDDEAPMALPAGQVARGRGRPKNLAGELKRKAAADRLAANGGVRQGRGRPRKNPDAAGAPDSAPQGTLGLHRFLFGPQPTGDSLPGKKGSVHKIKDTGTVKNPNAPADEFDEGKYDGFKSAPLDKDYEYRIHRKGSQYNSEWENHPDDRYHSVDDAKRVAGNMRKGTNAQTKITRHAREKMAGPVGKLPEGLGDDFAAMARGMKNKDGTPRFTTVRQGPAPIKPPSSKPPVTPRPTGGGASSPADWYDQSTGGKRNMGDSKINSKTPITEAKTTFKAYLSESYHAGSDAFEHILHRFKNEVKRFQSGEDMDTDLYDALFDYYCNSGEMPYGIAKARTGDPFEWVAAQFDRDMPAMDEAVNPMDVPAVQRKAAGQNFPLTTDQVNAPRPDSISDKRNLAQANGSKDLDDLARLAGITTESVSVVGSSEMMGDEGQEDKMNISTNQSSDGTKSITVTADGEAAVALLDMLKNAGMGGSDAAAEQEVIIAAQGDEHMGDEMSMDDGSGEMEMEEEYQNEPAPQYQSVEKITSAGDDMNREKKQNFPLRAPGNNPMSEMSLDPGKSMGRDLMAEYQAMKIKK